MKISNFVSGQWQEGAGQGAALKNPVNNEVLAYAGSEGVDLAAALAFARTTGGAALKALSYSERAGLLMQVVELLNSHREKYLELAAANSGNTATDAAIDVDGGIGTLKYFAAIGQGLGDGRYIAENGLERLTRDKAFQGAHIMTPLKGVAIHINAFNFPSWGLWEKAAVALLSGVPIFVKPATATSLLTHEMLKDVIEADILPAGSVSFICGGGHDLMDYVQSGDVVVFTGSADTAAKLKANPQVITSGVRFNVEADSVNMTILGDDVEADSELFGAFIKEVSREMTIKTGQRCTAIRRVIVPESKADAVAQALSARLQKSVVGAPAAEGVRVGPLVSQSQLQAAIDGLAILREEAEVVFGAEESFAPVGENTADGCFFQPTLLRCENPLNAQRVHDTEVFGPVATLMPYAETDDAITLAAMGGGSLAGSIFTNDQMFGAKAAVELSSTHGRLMVIDDVVMASHSGHGNVMPQCIHGGPGKAGGGEELGGFRGLTLYHQRTAVQGNIEFVEKVLTAGSKIPN